MVLQSLIYFFDIASAYNKNLKKGSQIDIAVLDFSKAFDTVPHDYNIDPYGQSFFPNCISAWNGLAKDIAEANTLDIFKSKFKLQN